MGSPEGINLFCGRRENHPFAACCFGFSLNIARACRFFQCGGFSFSKNPCREIRFFRETGTLFPDTNEDRNHKALEKREELMNLENLLSGALGALIVSGLDFFFLRKQGKLEERVNLLEGEKIVKLEEKIDRHTESDRSQEILTEIRNLTGIVTRLSDSSARSLESNAKQESQIAAHDVYLRNLDEMAKEHVRVYHHGKQ